MWLPSYTIHQTWIPWKPGTSDRWARIPHRSGSPHPRCLRKVVPWSLEPPNSLRPAAAGRTSNLIGDAPFLTPRFYGVMKNGTNIWGSGIKLDAEMYEIFVAMSLTHVAFVALLSWKMTALLHHSEESTNKNPPWALVSCVHATWRMWSRSPGLEGLREGTTCWLLKNWIVKFPSNMKFRSLR